MPASIFALDINGSTVEGSGLGLDISGVLEALPASMAFLCPNVNSYRRFGAQFYAPNAPSWGIGNRTVALRVPSDSQEGLRLEQRVASADANPCLVIAAILASIHHRLANKVDPGSPIACNPTNSCSRACPTTCAMPCASSIKVKR